MVPDGEDDDEEHDHCLDAPPAIGYLYFVSGEMMFSDDAKIPI